MFDPVCAKDATAGRSVGNGGDPALRASVGAGLDGAGWHEELLSRRRSWGAPSPEPRFLCENSEFLDLVAVLRRAARRRLALADVDDVIGDTFLSLVEARSRLIVNGTEVVDVYALAVAILKRRVSNLRRSARSRVLQVSMDRVESMAAAPGRISVQRGSAPRLIPMGRRQAAIVAIVLDGGTSADAAQKLGLPHKEVLRIMRHLALRFAVAPQAQ